MFVLETQANMQSSVVANRIVPSFVYIEYDGTTMTTY